MSKLTDRLSELGQSAPVPLGFGRNRSTQRNPVMLLIGALPMVHDPAAIPEAASQVDALLFTAAGDLAPPGDHVRAALEKRLWGVSVSTTTADTLEGLSNAGCDFVLVENEEAPGIVMCSDSMSRGFVVQPGLPDDRARALEDLAFDFFVLRPGPLSWPVTVAGLIRIQATMSLLSRHIVLQVDSTPDGADLELLRDLPISALLLDLVAIGSDQLTALRGAVDSLGPRKHRREPDRAALLPNQPGTSVASGHNDDDDDEDRGTMRHKTPSD